MFSVSDIETKSVLSEVEFLGDMDIFSSEGYHTFAITRRYTQEEIDTIFNCFKKICNTTGEMILNGPIRYDLDPLGRHYFIYYPEQRKGLFWKIRFSNQGFFVNGEYLTCTVKAIINPKMLVGEKSYIKAATEEVLNDIEIKFNEEANKITTMLGTFKDYSLNRIDYCINFDLSEVKVRGSTLESREQFALNMMKLISRGDIPNGFKREYRNENQFYLKSKSVVVNCYWKYADLIKNYPDCPDIEKSKDIIRFEIQFKYPKIFTEVKKYKIVQTEKIDRIYKELYATGYMEYLFDVNNDREYDIKKINYLLNELSKYEIEKKSILKYMLSNEKCREVINDYFYKIIGKWSYYTYKTAYRIIMREYSSWDKIVRLENTLKMITDLDGIRNVKNRLEEKKLEEFRRSLRELQRLRINPVTIPEEWGIMTIPNLLDNFYELQSNKQFEKFMEESGKQMYEDYLKDCKKKKK